MTTPEKRSAPGTLPRYLSPKDAAKFAGLPIGNRLLSVEEEANMLAAGLSREKIADMTPEALQNLADATVAQSDIFLGS